MLSYQHSFHAGNRADVLKHAVLHAVLGAASRPGQARLYIETHAGRGVYDLNSAMSRKTGEAELGVIEVCRKRPDALKPWLTFVEGFRDSWSQDQKESWPYPGSPMHAAQLLSPSDRLVLFEMHPAENAALVGAVSQDDRVRVMANDGFQGSLRLAPRRGEDVVCLVDPSYETASDIERVADWFPRALQRWRGGTILVWIPVFVDGRQEDLAGFLSDEVDVNVFRADWRTPITKSSGLSGSMIVASNLAAPIVADCDRIARALSASWR